MKKQKSEATKAKGEKERETYVPYGDCITMDKITSFVIE